jgi:DNA-binding response OmpR family regulator
VNAAVPLPTLLMVEDDIAVRQSCARSLRALGHRVLEVTCAEDVDTETVGAADAVLVDALLPGIDGYSLVRRLRQDDVGLPILVISGSIGLQARLRAYDCGADAFLTKPVAPAEIDALVRRIVVRRRLPPPPLDLDVAAGILRGPGGVHALSRREVAVLEALRRAPSCMLTRKALATILGVPPSGVRRSSFDTAVSRLRAKVRAASRCDDALRASYGRGLQLGVPVRTGSGENPS